MVIEFFMAMKIPSATHQEKKWFVGKDGKPHTYEPEKVQSARAKFEAYLAGHIPETPLCGALGLTTKWVYPATANHPENTWKETKPDTDNLVKLLKDVMTRSHFWKDDQQIAHEVIDKFYGRIPGIYIFIEEL